MPPIAVAAGPRLGVGSVIGRTFDTFGREWSLFLVLATPAALVGVLQLLVQPTISSQYSHGVFVGQPTNLWLTLVVSVVIATVGGLTGLACAVAADRLWRGQAPGIGDIVSAVRRSIPRAVPIWLLVIGLQVAFTLVAERFMPTTPGGRIPGTLDEQAAGLLAVVPIVLIGAIVLVFFQVRLSLILPVIALEDGPARGTLIRTWRLTHGHAIALFAITFLIGLCVFVTAWGASLFLVFGESRVVAAIALVIAELVATPLAGIWAAIAWGDLVGGRHADSALMARGKGRWTAVAIVFGLGAILLVAGFGVMGAAIANLL